MATSVIDILDAVADHLRSVALPLACTVSRVNDEARILEEMGDTLYVDVKDGGATTTLADRVRNQDDYTAEVYIRQKLPDRSTATTDARVRFTEAVRAALTRHNLPTLPNAALWQRTEIGTFGDSTNLREQGVYLAALRVTYRVIQL